jgi:hypothetical protein
LLSVPPPLLAVTDSSTDAVCVIEPDVPVSVTVDAPVGAVDEAASDSVAFALPPAAGVTVPGANVAVTPLGRPEALKLVAPLNPLRLATDTVLVPVAPWLTVKELGAALTAKSGEAVGEDTANTRSSDSS